MRHRQRNRATWAAFVALAAALTAGGAARGQADESGERTAADARLERAIIRTINLGVPMYNAGDHYGCYRLYQGLALGLASSGRDGLAALVEPGLARAESQPRYDLRATALRESLDKVLKVVGPAGGPGGPKPLWDRLGGESAVTAVVHDFVALAAPDPRVNFLRDGKYTLDAAGVANLERKLVELVSAVSGGPLKYTGGDMKAVHAGMGITDAQFDAIAGDLIAVLKKYKVPKAEADELVAAVASTRSAMVEGPSPPPTPTPAAPTPPPPAPSLPTASVRKTLFDRLGGKDAVVAVVDDFVGRAAGDPKVNFTRKGTAVEWEPTPANVAHLKETLVELIGQTTGGPYKYSGRAMKPSHKGMAITGAEFDAFAADLKATLDKFKVPAKEQGELFAIIGSTRDDIVELP